MAFDDKGKTESPESKKDTETNPKGKKPATATKKHRFARS